MELMTIVLGVVLLVLAYGLWVWWKDERSLQPFCGRVRHRIRTALGVASRNDMREVQEHLQHLEHQWETRLTNLEATAKFSNQLQYFSKEIDRRLTQLEISEGPTESSESGIVWKPRSIVRLGLRLTISDALWAHLGIRNVEDIEDHLIDTMVQGPFCLVCLKWLVGRNRGKNLAEVPAKCRHCGNSWDRQGTVELPISLVHLKRLVYEKLDQEYRASGTIRLYDY